MLSVESVKYSGAQCRAHEVLSAQYGVHEGLGIIGA